VPIRACVSLIASGYRTFEKAKSAVKVDFKVWEGVYASFREAPVGGRGFDGPIWRERSSSFAAQIMAQAERNEPLDSSLRQRYEFLPALTAMLLEDQPRVQILDFGGGLGIGFVLLTNALRSLADRVDYSIVEFADTCRAGNELFTGRKAPVFYDSLPDSMTLEIVHAASVLQYIEDWRGIVARLAAYGARYLVLTDVYIGEFATYVTSQNHHTSRIPHWFWNTQEFINEVEGHGYALAVRTHCQLKVLGKDGPLPMENFPPELRIAHGSNLLFSRRKKQS
jgi:putative methyltransferase (TIGR04325 family)